MPASETTLRQPRLRALANGALLPNAIEADILSNNHYAADRFRLAVANPDPALLDTGTIALDIQLCLTPGAWTSLIQGEADTIDHDPLANRLTLHGRDYAARLIEARTQETFANQTSSEIAATIAARHGLTSDVTATTTPVGRYWQLEHDRVTLDQFSRTTTEWDLLTTLAGHEGFDLWVTGTTLHFRPAAISATPHAILRPVATLTGPANVTTLRLERSLTLARDIEVTVKSWNSRQQTAFIQTARRTSRGDGRGDGRGEGRGEGRGQGKGSGPPQKYAYVVPNLTPDDALKLAQRKLAELTAHERLVTADMPGELALAPRQQIRLEGTGTSFDQPYWIDAIDRHLHFARGFTQRLHARNTSAGSQTTSPTDVIT